MKPLMKSYFWILRVARILNLFAGISCMVFGGFAGEWGVFWRGVFFVSFAVVICPLLLALIEFSEEL